MDVDEGTEPPDSLLSALASTPATVLARGIEIDDRYRIERVIGQGGMGVVYLARDVRLERDVAIKIAFELSALGRIAREALALARLSHPNVVVIHEVGEHDGQAYVAMEYVPGGTARAWCKRRSARDILALYLAAGDGLVAAHAAGLVHRDFKPDNVLVGADGRPRVADFGLALPERGERAGGTPAYMAPEQRDAAGVDARADQYAFCVSLLEALDGKRPPRHVEAALRRGRADDPADRWPALAGLLAELRRDRSRRKTRLVIGVGLLAAALAIGAVTRHDDADPCDRGGSIAWSPDAMRAAIAPPGAPAWRARDADQVVARLSAWSDRYAVTTRDVCRAGRVWSPALHDRGTACLARRAHQLRTLLDVLPSGADAADQLVDQLASPESCGDAAFLAAGVAPSTDARVHDLESELDRAHAITLAGHPKDAIAGADARLERAKALGYAPVVARALFERGYATDANGDIDNALGDVRDGYFGARREQDAELAAQAATSLALVYRRLSKDPQAGEWARLAEVEALASASPKAQLAALGALGVTATDRGEFEIALSYAERYLALAHDDPSARVVGLDIRVGVWLALGNAARALADADEQLRLLRAQYGDDHPRIARVETQRALVLVRMHRTDDALAAANRAIAIAEATTGPDSDDTSSARSALAVADVEAHRYDEALDLRERSLAHTITRDGVHSYNYASDLNNLGELQMKMGRLDDALASYAKSAEVFGEVLGANGFEVALVEANLANTLIQYHHALAAEAPARRARDIAAVTAPKSVTFAEAEIALGTALVVRRDRHAWAEAKEALTLGLAALDVTSRDGAWTARGRFQLAQVLAAEGDRVTAHFLATAARAYFKSTGVDAETVAEIDAAKL